MNFLLAKYNLSAANLLGKGMEAEVYAYGNNRVLKLYNGTATLDHLLTLQQFYNLLERERLPYALPRIHAVEQHENILVTIEDRLQGSSMAAILPRITDHLETLMQRYLSAVCALSTITMPPTFERYKLFDPDGISQPKDGDWHQFLTRYIDLKLPQVSPYLARDMQHFPQKIQQLKAILTQPYSGEYRLIHGDFFPGNLLVNADHQITALIDFGMMTMYGDPLFDVATSWVFFDMYDEMKVQARERLLPIILERLGEGVRGRLYRYVLIYSIVAANMYSSTCSDGQYQWCAVNLNNENYWKAVE